MRIFVSLLTVLLVAMCALGQTNAPKSCPFAAGASFNLNIFPERMAVADLNGDGKLDVVAVDFDLGSIVYVLLGNGDGTFQVVKNHDAPVGALGVAVADLNGDGKL